MNVGYVRSLLFYNDDNKGMYIFRYIFIVIKDILYIKFINSILHLLIELIPRVFCS